MHTVFKMKNTISSSSNTQLHPSVWLGRQAPAPQGLSTGFPMLDATLPQHGWPKDGITEIIATPGTGEMSLLLPTMQQLQTHSTLVWLSPPWVPHAPYLRHHGIELSRLLYVQAQQQEQQWAAEEALKEAAVGGVFYWPNKPLSFTAYRRLQILCAEHHKACFIFMQKACSNTPCSLKIEIQNRSTKSVRLKILKSRGQWQQPVLDIPCHEVSPFRYS